MNYKDLREWLGRAAEIEELIPIEGAHWDLEIGILTEELQRRRGPAAIFGAIPDYPPGHRILVNALGSPKRLALTLGLPITSNLRELLPLWQAKFRDLRPIEPKYVEAGSVLRNTRADELVDILAFPAPRWREKDGGRYIGTGCACVTSDRETGSLNVGCYRIMVHDGKHTGLYISPGKHGRMNLSTWFERGEPAPIAVCLGCDPLIVCLAGMSVSHGPNEYEYAGGIKGEPIELVKCPTTALPVPADAELVIEGLVHPGKRLLEGPFGEVLGYYSESAREELVIELKGVYFRDDPVIIGESPCKPPSAFHFRSSFFKSASVIEALSQAGVPGVVSVWTHELPGFIVVALKQGYAGHARQAGLVTAQCRAGAYLGRYVIVVDEDIDVMNLEEVLWAVCTRTNPAIDLAVLNRCWSSPLDPVLSPEDRKRGAFFNSQAIIDSTKPFEWLSKFPEVIVTAPQVRDPILKKWAGLLSNIEPKSSPAISGL